MFPPAMLDLARTMPQRPKPFNGGNSEWQMFAKIHCAGFRLWAMHEGRGLWAGSRRAARGIIPQQRHRRCGE